MGRLLEIVTPLHTATKRDYMARMDDDKIACMLKAREYEFDYWDGDRRYGYGGYSFIEGRWAPVAKALIDIYGLKDGSSVLDVGCGKGFLLYEMKKILPGLKVAGFDISKHGLADAREQVKPYLFSYRAQDPYPYGDDHFDLVISLGDPAQSAPVRTGDRGAGDRARRQEQIHHARGLPERRRAAQSRMLGADRRIHPAHVGMDLALQAVRLYRRLRIHLFRMSGDTDGGQDRQGGDPRRVAQAARRRRDHAARHARASARCWSRCSTSSICGAQINEIAAAKGPDKFLPHLLGHEALATVIETGPGVTSCKRGDTVVLHWRPGKGMQSPTPAYAWRGEKLNAGWVTTFNDYAVVSENRMTPVPASIDRRTRRCSAAR